MDLFSGYPGYSINENKECQTPCASDRPCYWSEGRCQAAVISQEQARFDKHGIQMDPVPPHDLNDTLGGGSKAKRKRKIKNSRHNTTKRKTIKRKTTKRKTTKRKKRSKQH